jgi:hypothetical protein
VGEVISASEAMQAQGLPERCFLALIAIAEKCHTDTRCATVRWKHIQDGLYGKSKRTAERAVEELRVLGVIRVVRTGFNNNHGRSRAPVYEIAPQGEWFTRTDTDTAMAESPSDTDTDKAVSESPHRYRQSGDDRYRHPGVVLDGSIDGNTGGLLKSGTSTGTPTGDTAPPQCRKHPDGNSPEPCRDCQARRLWEEKHMKIAEDAKRYRRRAARKAIDDCNDCDPSGWVNGIDPTIRCTHPNLDGHHMVREPVPTQSTQETR